jgi:hypothetical protein
MQEGSGYTVGPIGRPSLALLLPLALSYATPSLMYPNDYVPDSCVEYLLTNNIVVFQAELNAGASLMRAVPVCRPPKLGRARPRVPLEGHALSPKTDNTIQAIEFPTQEPLRSPTELKLYIFWEPPRGSSNH